MTTTEKRTRLRELATTLRDDLSLKGPWRWAGDTKAGNLRLCTRHGGQIFVMTFDRHGMRGGQPVFPVPDGEKFAGRFIGRMRQAKEVPVFEVAPTATSPDDPRVYRHDVIGFRSPAAEYLAEVDADTVLGLLDTIDALTERVAELTGEPSVDGNLAVARG